MFFFFGHRFNSKVNSFASNLVMVSNPRWHLMWTNSNTNIVKNMCHISMCIITLLPFAAIHQIFTILTFKMKKRKTERRKVSWCSGLFVALFLSPRLTGSLHLPFLRYWLIICLTVKIGAPRGFNWALRLIFFSPNGLWSLSSPSSYLARAGPRERAMTQPEPQPTFLPFKGGW